MTKARFEGPLDVRWTDRKKEGRIVRKLLDDLTFVCEIDGVEHRVTAPRGFLTDFASVPPVARKFIHPAGPYAPAAVIHDWLYINKIGERETADRIFLEAMKVLGVRWYTRSTIFRAVRLFGQRGWGR